jgi:hypothetical protein
MGICCYLEFIFANVYRLLSVRYKLNIYRVIHKSLRDFRHLRYSSRDGHAEGEDINRGRYTPSFCPNLQMLDMCTLVTRQMSIL